MTDVEALLELVLAVQRDLNQHKVDTANMLRVGPVTDRDHEKGARIEHGTDEESEKSPWVQPAERSGVERHVPQKGAHGMVLAPYGDSRQGVFIPYGHNDANKNPASDVDEVVLFNHDGYKISMKDKTVTHSFGKTKLTIKDGEFTSEVDGSKTTHTKDGITRKVGDVEQKLTKSGEEQTGGTIKHDGRNVGKDHKHSGVFPGQGETGDPEA